MPTGESHLGVWNWSQITLACAKRLIWHLLNGLWWAIYWRHTGTTKPNATSARESCTKLLCHPEAASKRFVSLLYFWLWLRKSDPNQLSLAAAFARAKRKDVGSESSAQDTSQETTIETASGGSSGEEVLVGEPEDSGPIANIPAVWVQCNDKSSPFLVFQLCSFACLVMLFAEFAK